MILRTLPTRCSRTIDHAVIPDCYCFHTFNDIFRYTDIRSTFVQHWLMFRIRYIHCSIRISKDLYGFLLSVTFFTCMPPLACFRRRKLSNNVSQCFSAALLFLLLDSHLTHFCLCNFYFSVCFGSRICLYCCIFTPCTVYLSLF